MRVEQAICIAAMALIARSHRRSPDVTHDFAGMVTLDPPEKREPQEHRPVLIVSPAELNAATKLPVVLPITSGGDFAGRLGFAVPISVIKTTGVMRCDQPRMLDLQTRNGRKVDKLPTAIMEDVVARLAPIFE